MSSNNLPEDNEFDLDIRITAMESSGSDVEEVGTDGRADAARNEGITQGTDPDTWCNCGPTVKTRCC